MLNRNELGVPGAPGPREPAREPVQTNRNPEGAQGSDSCFTSALRCLWWCFSLIVFLRWVAQSVPLSVGTLDGAQAERDEVHCAMHTHRHYHKHVQLQQFSTPKPNLNASRRQRWLSPAGMATYDPPGAALPLLGGGGGAAVRPSRTSTTRRCSASGATPAATAQHSEAQHAGASQCIQRNSGSKCLHAYATNSSPVLFSARQEVVCCAGVRCRSTCMTECCFWSRCSSLCAFARAQTQQLPIHGG